MFLLFMDESGTAGQPPFVLGGVAMPVERWVLLRSRWAEITSYDVRQPDTEAKWTDLKLQPTRASRYADAMADCEVTAFVVDVRTHEGLVSSDDALTPGDNVYFTALMFIAERYQRMLSRLDQYGVMIIDQRAEDQDERLRRFFGHLADHGTPFTSLDRIVEPILVSPSHHAIGIQAADLLVGSTRMVTLAELGEPVKQERLEVARDVQRRLLPCFARHPHTGAINGVGVKRFPNPAARDTKLFS